MKAIVDLRLGHWAVHLGCDHHGDAGHDRCGCQTKAPPAAGGGRGEEGAEENRGADCLVVAEATRAEGGAEGDTMLSSARRRSARTSAKEGNGRWRVMSCAMNWKRSFSPRRMFSTRVRSVTGSPRSARASVMPFITVVVDGESALG